MLGSLLRLAAPGSGRLFVIFRACTPESDRKNCFVKLIFRRAQLLLGEWVVNEYSNIGGCTASIISH